MLNGGRWGLGSLSLLLASDMTLWTLASSEQITAAVYPALRWFLAALWAAAEFSRHECEDTSSE